MFETRGWFGRKTGVLPTVGIRVVCRADPNATGAIGVQKMPGQSGCSVPVVNPPNCPVHPAGVVRSALALAADSHLPELGACGWPAT